MPEVVNFKTNLVVTINDINYGGHLGNQALVALLHEARVRFLQSLGYADELNVDGLGLIMVDLTVSFQSEAFQGDELVCDVLVGTVSRSGFDLYYSLKQQKGSTKIVADAKTGVLFFDYSKRTVARIPESFRAKLNL